MASQDAESPGDPACEVTCHESTPDRTVFTERGNADGWIATDLVVDCDP